MPVWGRALAFLLVVPGSIAGWLPWVLAGAPYDLASVRRGLWRLGALVALAGWGVLLACAREFATRGRGTPAPYDPPRQLVTSGFYRLVRNPMYTGVLIAILGQEVWYRSVRVAIYGAIAWLCFHGWVTLYEEPALTRSFGDAYREYCRRVPRWVPLGRDRT